MRRIILSLLLVASAIGSYAQMLPISDAELITVSETIIHGKVKSKQCKWVDNDKFIFTFVDVVVQDVFKGNSKQGETLTIAVAGGFDPVKDLGVVVSHQAEFEAGEEVILFLSKAEGYRDAINYDMLRNDVKNLHSLKMVNGFFQGKRSVYRDKQLNMMMVNKPNEGRSVEFQAHNEGLKQLINKLEKN